MPASNTTGLANPDFYSLGRGRLFAAELDVNGAPVNYRDLGNCPAFSTTIATEKLPHRSSREGLSTIDKEVVLSQDLTISFQLDEVSAENLTLLLAGTQTTYTNAAVAGITKYSMISSAVLGRAYEIKDSTGQRAYGINSADLTLEVGATALVKDTDYTVDEVNGMIFLLTTATNVADNDTVDLTLAAAAGAGAVTEVRGLTVSSKELAIKFLAENPANNDVNTEFEFHKVRVTSDGEFALISDEWGVMSFTGAAVKNTAYNADSPTMTMRYVAQ